MTASRNLSASAEDLLTAGMEIQFIDPESDVRWDRFVENHSFGWLTHLGVWKRIVETSFAHMKGYYPALVSRHDNQIRAALPVFEVRSWLTGRRMVSIPCATLTDPLVTSREEFELLAARVLALSTELGAGYTEIRMLHAAALVNNGRQESQPCFKHHFLRLEPDTESLRKTFHRSCVQQRIRKSLKSDLTLRIGENEADLQVLYALYQLTRKRVGLPPQPYLYFQKMWELLKPLQMVTLLIAEHKGTAVGAVLLLKYKDRVSAEVCAMNDEFNSMSPGHLLIWESICLAAREGYRLFDFGRTSPANGQLLEFKSRWGTEVSDMEFLRLPAVDSETVTKTNSWQYDLVRGLCKTTPDFLMPFIGSFCYRHMG